MTKQQSLLVSYTCQEGDMKKYSKAYLCLINAFKNSSIMTIYLLQTENETKNLGPRRLGGVFGFFAFSQ